MQQLPHLSDPAVLHAARIMAAFPDAAPGAVFARCYPHALTRGGSLDDADLVNGALRRFHFVTEGETTSAPATMGYSLVGLEDPVVGEKEQQCTLVLQPPDGGAAAVRARVSCGPQAGGDGDETWRRALGRCGGRYVLFVGPFWLRFAYVTSVLVQKY
jgi:hypothetical protein